MTDLNSEQILEFYYRSYTAVDGLWFMKVEEKYGFDVTLEIDNEVWKVLPKIQARMLKSMINAGSEIEHLFECFETKLRLEGFTFETEKLDDEKGFRIIVHSCPWRNMLAKSGREHLSGKVGTRICNTEGTVWTSEFGEGIRFELLNQICTGSESCTLQFSY